jgi:hypothetical protein
VKAFHMDRKDVEHSDNQHGYLDVSRYAGS